MIMQKRQANTKLFEVSYLFNNGKEEKHTYQARNIGGLMLAVYKDIREENFMSKEEIDSVEIKVREVKENRT